MRKCLLSACSLALAGGAAAAPAAHRLAIAAGDGAHRPAAAFFAGTAAYIGEDYPAVGANADGTDLWPCINYNGMNADCPTIGNPQIPLPGYAIVTGFPNHSFTLANTAGRGNGIGCDALTNGTGAGGVPYKPCAQLVTYYDDNTNDSTDDLLSRVRVVQNGKIVFDTGLVDYGPAGSAVKYPVLVTLFYDANFGYWPGASVGPNNGNCSGDLNYPLKSAAFPGGYYAIESNQTCSQPQAGPAKAFNTTILATPSYRKVQGDACTSHNVASPCYLVTYAKKYEIHQNFGFDLE